MSEVSLHPLLALPNRCFLPAHLTSKRQWPTRGWWTPLAREGPRALLLEAQDHISTRSMWKEHPLLSSVARDLLLSFGLRWRQVGATWPLLPAVRQGHSPPRQVRLRTGLDQ